MGGGVWRAGLVVLCWALRGGLVESWVCGEVEVSEEESRLWVCEATWMAGYNELRGGAPRKLARECALQERDISINLSAV